MHRRRQGHLCPITPVGRSLIEEAAPRHVEDVRGLVFDSLTDEQTAALASTLETIVSRAGQARIEPST